MHTFPSFSFSLSSGIRIFPLRPTETQNIVSSCLLFLNETIFYFELYVVRIKRGELEYQIRLFEVDPKTRYVVAY